MSINLESFERTLRPFFEKKGLTITLKEPNIVTVVNSSGVTTEFRPEDNIGLFDGLNHAASQQKVAPSRKPKHFPEDAPV